MSRIDKLLSKELIHNVPFKVIQRDTKKDIEYPFPRINYNMLHSCYATIVCCNNIHGSSSRTHIFIVGLIVIYLLLKKSQLTNLFRAFGPLTSHVKLQN